MDYVDEKTDHCLLQRLSFEMFPETNNEGFLLQRCLIF